MSVLQTLFRQEPSLHQREEEEEEVEVEEEEEEEVEEKEEEEEAENYNISAWYFSIPHHFFAYPPYCYCSRSLPLMA